MSKLLKRSRRSLRPVHLPSEIISNVLDSLLLDDIVRASHVSRIWRSAAREHRTYCRHITYDHDAGSDRDRPTGRRNESNLQFFLSRLSARPQGKIDSLSISLRNTASSWGCETDRWQIFMIIPALRTCLHRVVQLYISISIDDRRVPALLTALMVPAPELTFLSLHGQSGHIVPTLPVGLFAGHAPKLDVLDVNWRLPATPIPAFASVKVVNHDTSQDEASMTAERFFMHCPRLEELHIDCNSEPIGDAFLAACPPPQVVRLRKLTVTSASTDADTETIVRAFSHAGLEHFRAYAPAVNGATFALLLSHLANSNSTSPDGKLQLDILYDRADIFWEFSDYDAARARCFVFWHSIPEPDNDMDSEDDFIAELDSEYVAHCAAIAHRIVRLAIAYNIHTWQFLLSIFPDATVTLSGITTLSLVLSSTTTSSKFLDLVCLPVGRRHGGTRPLPSLRLIELVAVDEVRVEWEVGALAHFIGNVLGRVARRELEMQLKGVVIVGDLARVWGYFRSITIVPCE